MKEEKIIAVIGTYACIIMADLSKGKMFPWIWIGLAIFWFVKYVYLELKD